MLMQPPNGDGSLPDAALQTKRTASSAFEEQAENVFSRTSFGCTVKGVVQEQWNKLDTAAALSWPECRDDAGLL
jgi:hypothetical protein